MIELPDPDQAFTFENAFHLTAPVPRVAKFLAHFELFRAVAGRPGAIVECGVFKGASFCRFASFRDLLGHLELNPLVGFDTFDAFPRAASAVEQAQLDTFLAEAGAMSIGVDQLHEVLKSKGVAGRAELVAGDILDTVPAWVASNPTREILLLHVDVDLYEPAGVILEHLWPRLVPGGLMILDDYGRWEGTTRAFHEYFGDDAPPLRRPSFTPVPVHVVKA